MTRTFRDGTLALQDLNENELVFLSLKAIASSNSGGLPG